MIFNLNKFLEKIYFFLFFSLLFSCYSFHCNLPKCSNFNVSILYIIFRYIFGEFYLENYLLFRAALCHKSGASNVKEDGYSVSEVITLIVMFPLMMLSSINAFYRSHYDNVIEMKKDVIYRLKNNEKMPWRKLLYAVCKQFKHLTNSVGNIDEKSAYIIDDTADTRTGYKIENISIIHNHGSGKKGSVLGFKKMVLFMSFVV